MGQWIGARLPDDAVVGLDGTLGTGKTCLVQGLAHGLGIPGSTHITSPAYNLIQTYTIGRQKLTHIDFYRLSSLTMDDFMLFEEAFSGPRNIVVAEWASGIHRELCTGVPARRDFKGVRGKYAAFRGVFLFFHLRTVAQ